MHDSRESERENNTKNERHDTDTDSTDSNMERHSFAMKIYSVLKCRENRDV